MSQLCLTLRGLFMGIINLITVAHVIIHFVLLFLEGTASGPIIRIFRIAFRDVLVLDSQNRLAILLHQSSASLTSTLEWKSGLMMGRLTCGLSPEIVQNWRLTRSVIANMVLMEHLCTLQISTHRDFHSPWRGRAKPVLWMGITPSLSSTTLSTLQLTKREIYMSPTQ